MPLRLERPAGFEFMLCEFITFTHINYIPSYSTYCKLPKFTFTFSIHAISIEIYAIAEAGEIPKLAGNDEIYQQLGLQEPKK